ncbi:MAG: DUF4224 domain-containing protein [Rhodoferax sp.]|nr:MAG: DUF4224 domain-containing protein [Rhodoferax sp.]
MTEFLNPQEMHALTSYARAGQQSEWLKTKGIPHRVDGRRVIVSREHVRNWLEGRTMVVSRGLNTAAIK